MTRQEVLSKLPAWIFGDLPDPIANELELALDADAELASIAEGLRITQSRATSLLLTTAPVPAPLIAEDPAQVPEAQQTEPSAQPAMGRRALVVALAAGIAALVLGAFVLGQLTSSH